LKRKFSWVSNLIHEKGFVVVVCHHSDNEKFLGTMFIGLEARGKNKVYVKFSINIG
jgi:hypothetical protein